MNDREHQGTYIIKEILKTSTTISRWYCGLNAEGGEIYQTLYRTARGDHFLYEPGEKITPISKKDAESFHKLPLTI